MTIRGWVAEHSMVVVGIYDTSYHNDSKYQASSIEVGLLSTLRWWGFPRRVNYPPLLARSGISLLSLPSIFIFAVIIIIIIITTLLAKNCNIKSLQRQHEMISLLMHVQLVKKSLTMLIIVIVNNNQRL